MMWLVYALIAVIGASAMPIIQNQMKAESIPMLLWCRVFTLVLLTPWLFTIDWPDNPAFYAVAFGFGMVVTYSDYLFFNFVRTNNPAIAMRIMKSSALLTFFLWLAIDPRLVASYQQEPIRASIIILALVGAVIAAGRMKKCTVSMGAIYSLWPVFIVASVYPVLSKYVLIGSAPFDGAVATLLVQCMAVIGTTLVLQKVRRLAPPATYTATASIQAGAALSLASVIAGLCSLMAFQMAANPAYASVILFLSPVLVALYGHLRGQPDHSDQRAGFALVLAAAIIAIGQLK